MARYPLLWRRSGGNSGNGERTTVTSCIRPADSSRERRRRRIPCSRSTRAFTSPVLLGATEVLRRTERVHVEVGSLEEETVLFQLDLLGFELTRRTNLGTGDVMLQLERWVGPEGAER